MKLRTTNFTYSGYDILRKHPRWIIYNPYSNTWLQEVEEGGLHDLWVTLPTDLSYLFESGADWPVTIELTDNDSVYEWIGGRYTFEYVKKYSYDHVLYLVPMIHNYLNHAFGTSFGLVFR